MTYNSTTLPSDKTKAHMSDADKCVLVKVSKTYLVALEVSWVLWQRRTISLLHPITPSFCSLPCLEELEPVYSVVTTQNKSLTHVFRSHCSLQMLPAMECQGQGLYLWQRTHSLWLYSCSETPVACWHFILTHHNIWGFYLLGRGSVSRCTNALRH